MLPAVHLTARSFRLALLVLLAACQTEPDAQRIIDQAMAAHGTHVLGNAVVDFDYRGRHFEILHAGGRFAYTRTYTDSTGRVEETLDNDGVVRRRDGQPVALTDKEQFALVSPLNSVPYFALLPHKLNDAAVQKRYLGADTVRGEPYHEVEITFQEEGGGRDHDDRFVYWVHQDRHTIDYLAYTFTVNDGGTRFREAVNPRTVGGVRFADYRNYTHDTLETHIEAYDDLFEQGDLALVSEINLENVQVRPAGEEPTSR